MKNKSNVKLRKKIENQDMHEEKDDFRKLVYLINCIY